MKNLLFNLIEPVWLVGLFTVAGVYINSNSRPLTMIYTVSLVVVDVVCLLSKQIAKYLFMKYGSLIPGTDKHYIPYLGIGERPRECPYTSYGFPSGHSMLVMYYVAFLVVNGQTQHVGLIVSILFALTVMYSRVEVFHCHYPNQVVYGGIIGVLLAYLVPALWLLVISFYVLI